MKCRWYKCDNQRIGHSDFCSKQCSSRWHDKRRCLIKKKRGIELLGGKCSKCGYDKCIAALDFHHRDPKEKSFNIARTRGWERVKNELSKCILLCSNCHREEHYNHNGDNENYTLLKDNKKERNCPQCNKNIKKGTFNKFCSKDCFNLYQRKVVRPSKELLNQMIQIKSKSEIGREYGVSYLTISKWCKMYKINKNKPTKDQLLKEVWEIPSNELCKKYNVTEGTLKDWCDSYSIKKPHASFWRKPKTTKEVLEKEVWETPTSILCKKYNVTDSAIQRWCKYYNIQKPPRGYWSKFNK